MHVTKSAVPRFSRLRSRPAIADLRHHYLDGIPRHHALSAQISLYGNAKIRFGQNIVLREHFRCMPEIIHRPRAGRRVS
jgi:hypothetical protein